MNPHDHNIITRQLDLLQESAFRCMDARDALTEDNDPQVAHDKINDTMTMLKAVRDSLRVKHGLTPGYDKRQFPPLEGDN